MMTPVKDEDGHIESFILRVAGKDYFCRCGCNCFHKPDDTDLKLYKCSGCGATFRDMSGDKVDYKI